MINCALNTNELEFVYGLTKQSIQAKLDAGNPFNVDSYMKYLYNRIEKVSDRERAAQFLAFTPAILESVVLNNFTDNIDQIEGYDKVSVLKAKWANPDTVIQNVVNALEQTKTNLRITRLLNQQQENIVTDNNEGSAFDYNMVPRYKAINILSTTLPSFKPGTTKFEKEVPDTERTNINNIVSSIVSTMSLEDTVLKYPKYQDVNIRLKAVNLGQFVNGTYEPSKLDSTTRKEIARSLDIQNPKTPGAAKPGVDQVQDRVIVLITDEKGQPLSFDSAGNIVTEASPNSTFAYQMMRSIRKKGNGYTIRDIYNLEDKVLSSSDIADIRAKELNIPYEQALKQTNSEFKKYYALKNKALDEDIFLDLIGMTKGLSIEKTTKEANVNTLIENKVLSPKDLESIRTLVVAEGNIKSGHAAIDVGGNAYAIDRPRMSSDLASQIENVLFAKDISVDEKFKFSEQYIENKYISDKAKRHDIIRDPSSGDLYIKVYSSTKSKKFPRNTIFEIRIDNQGNIFENETTPANNKEVELRDEFRKALLNTYPNGKSVFLTYSEDLFKSPFDLKTFEGGKIKTTIDYIEFIQNQNPIVYIVSNEQDFYNKQMLFQETNDNELNDITENLPVDKRFSQLDEEEYLGNLLLQKTPDGKNTLKDEYKGKLIYSTPGLFSPEAFKDTDVVHTNDITVDLIPSIQMGNGEIFRERNENESIQDYIFAFSKTGYKTDYLDPAVTNRIKQLTEQGVTVVTETSARIKDTDLVVFGDRNNPGVQSFNLKESFFQKELNATEKYLNNLTEESEPKRVIPYVNKQIVREQATSTDTDKPNDPNNEELPLLRDGKLNADKLSAEDINRANTFWNKTPFGKALQKSISLNKAANLVNSDAYANFVVSGATLMNPDIKGTININNSKGSMVDVYHESFHAFTQLYLTKQQKIDLYEEVLNYNDKNGNKPYEGKSYLEIEEILAEDFRTYMKKNVAKPNSPMRNSIFRKIVQMLQKLFGKIIPSLKNVQLDIMSVPTVNELYENLNFGKAKFFNQYQASVDNKMFSELDRGITYSDKINDEEYNRTALSKQDSDLITSSIDSIISDIIDDRYKDEVKKTTLKGSELESYISKIKGLSLSSLLNPKSRAITYKKVLTKLKDRLAKLNKEYDKSVGKSGISEINTFKNLTDNAVATLETNSGIHKYVLLKSQIDSYKDFDSYFKRGSRIRGEEWKGIKIVGDYFTHSTIKDNSREGKPEVPAQIIIVSRIEDAKTQYDNYVKGGSKEYKRFKLNAEAVDSDLTYEQENLLDNIRILETAVDQFGDPNYILNKQKPTGVIAYHIKNSNFEIDNVKYTLDEVPSSEKLFEDQFQKSLLDLADKEVIYILKSLHKIENGNVKLNKLGFKENVDFRKVWNTLSKVIGGVQSRQEMFDIIKQESENFPELEQLWQVKLPSPSNIQSTYAFDISSSFWHTFSRPSITHWQLTSMLDIDKFADGTSTASFDFVVNESTIELNRILSDFENRFKISKNKYMLRYKDQPALLDTAKLYDELIGDSGVLSEKNKLTFLRTLGFKLDNTKKLEEALKTRQSKNDINNLVTLTKDLNNIILKPRTERTQLEKKLLKRFSLNPIKTLRDSDFIKKSIKALPSFKSEAMLRADSIVRNLGNIQASYGFDTPGDAIKLPDGNNAYSVANHSSASSIILGVNELNDLNEAYVKNGHLSFLNPTLNNRGLPYNPWALRNKVLNTMFPTGGKRDSSKEMQLIVLAGTETITSISYPELNYSDSPVSEGLTTGDLTATDKLFQAYNMLLSKGIGEFIRHSDKKTAFGIQLNKRKEFNGISTGTNENLWIDIEKFRTGQGDAIAFEAFILDYIASEFDRIQYFSQPENKNVLETTTGYNRKLSNGRKAGLSFVAMDSLLPEKVKTFLYEQAKNPEVVDIKEVLKNSNVYNSLKDGVNEYFRKKSNFIIKKLGPKVLETNLDFEKYDALTLAKAYTYNDFINRLEMSNLLNGDLAQFKDFTKRVPGSTSDGDGFLYDTDAQNFINEVFQKQHDENGKGGVETYAKSVGIADFKFDGTLNTGVIKDPKRASLYLEDMQDAWTRDYKAARPKLTDSQIADRVTRDSDAYLKMEEADGAAYLTIDAYRVLRKLGNKWSVEQENLYQDMVNNPEKEIDSTRVSKFFPVYKLHNYGSLMNAPIATTSMFKFAVAPIIPSIAKPGTELYKLHNKMLESNIQMVTFKSGSKAANLTSKPNTESDNIFEKLDDLGKLNRNDKYVQEDNSKAPIKNNKVHLRYLKDVTAVADKLKNSLTVGTQSRVIVESQLYSMGKLVNSNNKKIAADYRKAVKNYTDILEKELLNEIGFTVDKSGKYVPKSKGSLARLAGVVRAELEAKGSPTELQNLIDVNLDGNLKIDFSIHPEAQVVEQILVNRISKAISGQKTKGESDVQVPSTFYNGVWSSELERDAAIINNEAEIRKFLGTNNLPFYRYTKDGIKLAKVAIPFNGDFLNLLNLEDPDNPGEIIGTRKRLNELLKDEDWLKEHGDKVTITGPRIPTDDTNLVEGFEVWHFIDASAGSTAVVPTEIVAKAGSDFDVDKLFFSFPNIDKDGSLPTESGRSIEEQKRFAQNELIRTSVEILKLPELYGALTKPASTYLFKSQAKPEPTDYEKVHASLKENPTKFYEYEYNNIQHDLLMGGSVPLGILAKMNKQFILYMGIGAKMPLRYLEKNHLVRDMRMRFKHNETDQGNILMSKATNVDGVKISEILSHGLQGVLDRGNDSFPTRAGISTESLPVLGRLIQSGVSLPQAVKFVQQPLIEEYFNNLAKAKGPLAKLKGEDMSKRAIVDEMLRRYVDNNAIAYYNKMSQKDALDALKINPNKKIIVETFGEKDFVGTAKKWLRTQYKPNKKYKSISFYDENGYLYTPLNPKSPGLLYKTYHLGEYFWNTSYGNKVPTAQELASPNRQTLENELQQVALLFELLNIENQSSGMQNFELNFNPDTGLLMNLDGALERRRFVESLKVDTKVDIQTIDNFLENSVLSSMYKTQIFEDIVEPLFALRLDKNLKDQLNATYLKNRLNILERFGPSTSEATQKYSNEFNNGVVDYIYQNMLSNYVSKKTGLPTDLPEEIRERKVIKKNLSGDSVVSFKEKTVQIDVAQIKKDYKNNLFMIGNDFSGNDTFEFSPFPTLQSYMRYVIEREYFRETYKEFANNTGFEERISKRALASSFNRAYILGDAGFGPSKYSYTKDVMEFIDDPLNETIVQNFPVLQHLKPSFYMASRGYNLLSLDNKNLIDNATASDYISQLKKLGDPTFRIIPESPVKDKMISDLFKNFSLMAIYQQGTGKSGLSFLKSLDPEPFVQLIKVPAIQFQKTVLKDLSNLTEEKEAKALAERAEVFENIAEQILDLDSYKNYLVEPSEFTGKFKKEKLADQDKKDKFFNVDNSKLFIRYREALANKKLDDAMSENGEGTARLKEVEDEIVKRGLPLITSNANSVYQPENNEPTVDYSREWSGDLESRPVYTKEGINTMRTSDDKTGDENFGNPFAGPIGFGLVKLDSVTSAVSAYKDWLLGKGTTDDYGIDPKVFVKAVIKSMGGKPTSKGMFAIDGQHYYIEGLITMNKPGGQAAFIIDENDNNEIYLGFSKGSAEEFVSEDSYYLSDLASNQREWILDQIDEGKLDKAKLLYSGSLASRGEGTHAEALIEAYNAKKNDTEVIIPGVQVKRKALSTEEQQELFTLLKPLIEEQAAKTNKGENANVMIGLGLRWDYKSNNPGKERVDLGEIINPASKSKYGYYTESINGQPLAPISPRIKELMTKATGIDSSNYDAAIINLYSDDTFISVHNDVDESIEAIKYPVLVANIGGSGNFSVERVGKSPVNLNAGDSYVFGIDGKNRTVFHRTFPSKQDGFFPEITTKLDGKTYPEGSYRISITMRRAKPIKQEGLPTAPKKLKAKESTNRVINEGLGQTLLNFTDPQLETFYAGLSNEQRNNPNLPSVEYAQDFYSTAPHAYKNINEYIEALKCI